MTMKIKEVKASIYKWTGPVNTTDTSFTNPLSALPFQKDSQTPYRFVTWLVVEVVTDSGVVGLGNAGLCPDVCKET